RIQRSGARLAGRNRRANLRQSAGRGGTMSDIRTVEFNALPMNVRERFAAITIGTSGPAPLLSERTSTGTKIIGPVFGALVLLVLVIGLLGGGAGDLYNNLAIHGPL